LIFKGKFFYNSGSSTYTPTPYNNLSISGHSLGFLPFNLVQTVKQINQLEEFNSFREFIKVKNVKRLFIDCPGNLGDNILLLPILKEIQKTYHIPKIIVTVQKSYLKFLRRTPYAWFSSEELPLLRLTYSDDFYVGIQAVLENDHRPEIHTHRLDIFREFFGLNTSLKPPKFSVSLSKKTDSRLLNILKTKSPNIKKPIIGLQLNTFSESRTFYPFLINQLLKDLRNKYFLIGISHNVETYHQQYELDFHAGYYNPTLAETLFLMKELNGVIVMDSGPLWFSHITKTPTLLLIGSRTVSSRLKYHPLYPKKAFGISTYDIVDCKPCGDTGKFCSRAYPCVRNFDTTKIQDKFNSYLSQFLD